MQRPAFVEPRQSVCTRPGGLIRRTIPEATLCIVSRFEWPRAGTPRGSNAMGTQHFAAPPPCQPLSRHYTNSCATPFYITNDCSHGCTLLVRILTAAKCCPPPCRIDDQIKKLDAQLAVFRDQIRKARPGPAQESLKRRALAVSSFTCAAVHTVRGSNQRGHVQQLPTIAARLWVAQLPGFLDSLAEPV